MNIEGELEYQALKEYRAGLLSRAGDFQGLRFNPCGDEERETLGKLDGALKKCRYTTRDELRTRLKGLARDWGCSESKLFHSIRSAKGPGLEVLEAEMRWGVKWDVVGLAETWLDGESEQLLSVQGYSIVCASRKKKSGGGVAIMLKEGLVYRERTDLGVFLEGDVESIFVELVKDGGNKKVVFGVVYRPPNGD